MLQTAHVTTSLYVNEKANCSCWSLVPVMAHWFWINPTGNPALQTCHVPAVDLVNQGTLCLQVEIEGRSIRLGGFAKGSGMIHPNMATMLALITCDAPVEPQLWRAMFRRGAAKSFNQVDGQHLAHALHSESPWPCLSM